MLAYDWQTIVVTLVALGALLIVVRRLLDLKGVGGRKGSGASCPSCASGASACAPRSRKQQPAAVQSVQVLQKRRTG